MGLIAAPGPSMIASWSPLPACAACRLGWKAASDLDGLDPYLAWADATGFLAYGDIPAGQALPFLLELERTGAHASAGIAASPLFQALQPGLQYADVHARSLQGSCATITALVQPGYVLRLRDASDAGGEKLQLRAQLALPSVTALVQAPAAITPGTRTTIAVIDDGLPFAHAKFRQWDGKAWHTRVRYFWDQGRDASGGWRVPGDLGYGRELDAAAIDALMKAATRANGTLDEDAVYAAAGYERMRHRSTHGSVVADIAAGAPDPLHPGAKPDAACQADLVFIQLPRTAVDDFAAGALEAFIVDALRYTDARSGGRPLAINLSYGTFAGPHDGTSLLDVAFDAFLAGRDDCVLVVPAGNTRDTRTHAYVQLDGKATQALRWQVQPDDATDTFMEVWLPGAPPNPVKVRLLPPGTDPGISENLIPFIGASDARIGCDAAGRPVCGVLHPARCATGRNGTMVLAAIAPTRARPGRAAAPAGTWTVQLRTTGAPVKVHAWIERDDGSLATGGKQSRFEEGSAALSEACTLGSFSHADAIVVVGGCIDDERGPRPLTAYTGCGPSRVPGARTGPDAVAGSEESVTLTGLRAAATHSGDSVRLAGTSVAAPVVVRQAVNGVLAAGSGRSSAQVKAALLDLAKEPDAGEPQEHVGRGRFKSR